MLGNLFRNATMTLRATASSLLAGKSFNPAAALFSRGMANHRHRKMLKLAKGYRGRANRCFSVAKQRVDKARQYAFVGRKVRKREFRSLWIQRLNASSRMYGTPYNIFINSLNNCGPLKGQSDIILNRKVLADLAVTEPLSFRSVLEVVKQDAAAKKQVLAQSAQ